MMIYKVQCVICYRREVDKESCVHNVEHDVLIRMCNMLQEIFCILLCQFLQ